jgi:hypothetical protein
MTTKPLDVQADLHGSICMIRPLSLRANRWITKHVYSESWQWLSGTLCIDSRMAADIVTGMKRSRLRLDVRSGA